MLHIRNFYIFLITSLTSISVYTYHHEVTSTVLFLRKLSYIMWHSFFFVTKTLGAFIAGDIIYIIQALILWGCMIAIESYSLHRILKTPFLKTLPRMALINMIELFIQVAIAYPLFHLIDLHNHAKNFDTFIYLLYGLTICASIIMLACRTITSYLIYQRFFDTKTDKNILKKAFIKTNCLSYSFIVAVFFIAKLAKYQLI